MKKTTLLLLILITASSFVMAQTTFSSSDPAYITNVKLGEKALNSENYDSCLVYYATAFEVKQTSVLSTLRATACAYSKGDVDQYGIYLDKCFSLDFDQTKGIFENYPEFNYLKDSKFEETIQTRWEKEAKAAGLDIKLMEELAVIGETDQTQRQEMRGVSEKYGWQSPQMDSLWKIQSFSDSVNLVRIKEIIEKHGYPGKSLVGSSLASTTFLVIQHSDQETQEKYLPLLSKAADDGEVRWSSIALLIDRVQLGRGDKQTYGSQIHSDNATGEQFFGPIENPYKIDSIRATVGLGPIQNYADNWDIKWDPKKHIERHKMNAKKE